MTQEPIPDQLPVAGAWAPMQFHVQIYLANHPLLRGFHLETAADAEGITAELQYCTHRLRAMQAQPGWWEPRTPDHGRELADLLARDLYAQWIASLRRH